MILKDFFNAQLNELTRLYPRSEARKILELFYEAVLDIPQFTPGKYDEMLLDETQITLLKSGFQKLMESTPVQYVVGRAWFYGYAFKVSPAVLIPRPETEEMVEQIVKTKSKNETKKILDIGTGSGCIPIVLKKKLPLAEITAIDVEIDALNIAKLNADILGTSIQFINQDFLDETQWEKLAKFDIIVSNPPYIGKKESLLMEKTVIDFEPPSALFVPDHQVFIFYEKIADFGLTHLSESGEIYAEINQLYPQEIKAIFTRLGYQANIIEDMSGNPRIVRAIRFP